MNAILLKPLFILRRNRSTHHSFANTIVTRENKWKASYTTFCSQRATRLRLHPRDQGQGKNERFFASQKLSQVERDSVLNKLLKGEIAHGGDSGVPHFASWKKMDDKDAISKTFEFTNFSEAWGFMSRVALVAEKASKMG